MEIIAMESAAYQDLKERLERLEQYIAHLTPIERYR